MNNLETEELSHFWHLSIDDVLTKLSCRINGLTDKEANERLKQYGLNTIKSKKRVSTLVLFLSQFKSPITLLLIVAALLSAGLGDVTDTIIILVIVLISSLLSFWQEKGAAHAVDELLKLMQLNCMVLRGGEFVPAWRFRHLGPARAPWLGVRSQGEGVDADAIADRAGAGASIAERQRQAHVRLGGGHPRGRAQRPGA